MYLICTKCKRNILKFEQVGLGSSLIHEEDGDKYYHVLCDACGEYRIKASIIQKRVNRIKKKATV